MRSKYHIFNQTDRSRLDALGSEYGPFDVIIDDAGHFQIDMLTTFDAMFPYLRPGGIYVFEDCHLSYVDFYGGHGNSTHPKAGAGTVIQFAKDLVNDVNLPSVLTGDHIANPSNVPEHVKSRMTFYSRRIDSIHFYVGLCFILTREVII